MGVFVVDDNEGFTEVARGLLERGGLIVTGVAKTGDEALRLVRESRPDVVLVDIDLGGESGFDLVRRLHADAELDPQVILISSHAEEDFIDLIAESSALGFLAKSRLSVGAIRDILDERGPKDALADAGPSDT